MTKIFVGNLPWGTDDQQLRQDFQSFGTITEARVITDRETGRSRGFGFITYGTPDEAQAAVSSMNGVDVGGRPLTVNLATERPSRR